MQVWISKNRHYLGEKFPKLSKKLLPHFNNITTSSFAVGVVEEFIIICIITIFSYVMNWYSLWLGLFIAFTFHLFVHCIQTLLVRKYVPAIVTSIICLPVCVYIIKYIVQFFRPGTVAIYAILSMAIMVVNLGIIHKFMDIFSKWLAQYEHSSR